MEKYISEPKSGQGAPAASSSPTASEASQVKGTVGQSGTTLSASPESVEKAPFVGPRPFATDDKEFFAGRAQEARELRALIKVNRAVLMYAQSGAGKTSLLNAGLIPLLESGDMEVYRPERVSGLLPDGVQAEQVDNRFVFNVLYKWNDGRYAFSDLAKLKLPEFLQATKKKVSPDDEAYFLRLLIFDQFEELFFSYPEIPEKRLDFIRQVAAALEQDRQLRCLFAMREDYLARFDRYAPYLPDGVRAHYHMEPLRAKAAMEAIRVPLLKTQRTVKRGVAASLVRDLLKVKETDENGRTLVVRGEFVEPVQLQILGEELYGRLGTERVVTRDHIQALDVNRVLIRFFDAKVKKAAEETRNSERTIREWIIRNLITEFGTRSMVAMGKATTKELPSTVLQTLEKFHIVRVERRSGADWCELIHDALIEPIQRSWRLFDAVDKYNIEIEKNPDKADPYVEKASVLVGLGEESAALDVFQEAIKVDKNCWKIYLERGLLHARFERLDKAIDDFRECIRLNPNDKDAHKALVEGLTSLGRNDEAIKALDLALTVSSEIAWAHEKRGYIHLELSNFAAAVEDFRQSVVLQPYDKESQARIVAALVSREHDTEALQIIDKMIEVDPGYSWSYTQEAQIHKKHGDYAQAARDLCKALELDAGNHFAVDSTVRELWDLSMTLQKRGEYDEAVSALNQVIKIEPDYPTSYNLRALVNWDRRSYAPAKDDLTKAMELAPNEPLYPRNLGNLFKTQKNYEEAENWYHKALEVDPAYAVAFNDLGLLYQDLKRDQDAEASFHDAMDADPAEALYPRNLGNFFKLRKNYEEAEKWFRKALKIYPEYGAAYNDLGLLNQDLRHEVEAEANFRRAMEVEPKSPLYPRNLGDLYKARRNYAEAESWYRKAVELDPGYAAVHNDLGLLYRDLNREQEAEVAFQQAMQSDRNSPLYPRNLGDLYKAQRNYAEAEKWYRKSLAVDPSYAAAYNDLGLLYQQMNRGTEAEKAFEQAMQADNSAPLYPRNMGDLYKARKNYAEAEKWYRKSLEVDQTYAPVHNDLGLLYRDLKRVPEAEAAFLQAIEHDPYEPIYPRNLGYLYEMQKRLEDAEIWYRKAIEVEPAYAAAYNNLALLYQQQKQDDTAETHFRKAMECDPKEPLYLRNLGDLYKAKKNYEEAEKWYRKALEVNSSYAVAHNDLGLLYQELQRWDESDAAFRDAIQSDPSEPLYSRNLGNLYYAQKKYDEAEKWYGKALEINSSYAPAQNDLGLMFQDLKRMDDAAAAFQRAINADPTEPIYPRNLGYLYNGEHKYKEAEQALRKAAAIAPDDAMTVNALAWMLFEQRRQLDEAEQLSRRAIQLQPDVNYLHTLSAILVRQGRWEARSSHSASGCGSQIRTF